MTKLGQAEPNRAKHWKCLFTGTVPVNEISKGTVRANKDYPTGTIINKLAIFSSKSTLYRTFHGCVCLAAPNRSYVFQRRSQKSTSRIVYRSPVGLFSWKHPKKYFEECFTKYLKYNFMEGAIRGVFQRALH